MAVEHDPEEDDILDDDGEDFEFDCGWTSDGCTLAGSEDCDFECPYRDGLEQEWTVEPAKKRGGRNAG